MKKSRKPIVLMMALNLFCLTAAAQVDFVPRPVSVEYREGKCILDKNLQVKGGDAFNVRYLKDHLARVFNPSGDSWNPAPATVISMVRVKTFPAEGYSIDVRPGEILRKAFPENPVCDCVIYTVSEAQPDFSIRQLGRVTRLFIGAGADDPEAEKAAQEISRLLKEAGLHCLYRQDTRAEDWKKFILNCAFNVVTAARGVPTGKIAENPAWAQEYRQLMEEAREVSEAEGVGVEKEAIDRFQALLPTYDPASESSLSRDFARQKEGEWEIFSSEVIRRAEAAGIEVPVTRKYEAMMRERIQSWTR